MGICIETQQIRATHSGPRGNILLPRSQQLSPKCGVRGNLPKDESQQLSGSEAGMQRQIEGCQRTTHSQLVRCEMPADVLSFLNDAFEAACLSEHLVTLDCACAFATVALSRQLGANRTAQTARVICEANRGLGNGRSCRPLHRRRSMEPELEQGLGKDRGHCPSMALSCVDSCAKRQSRVPAGMRRRALDANAE